MFGYVVIDKPNILIKDYQTYRSYYCGLCKAIGRRYGTAMRFTLNYDIVLLALLGYNYEDAEPIFCEEHCITHPISKVPSIKDSDILGRVADINIILGYFKASDDVTDENRHRVWKAVLKPAFKKAAKRMPDLTKKVQEGYNRIRESEKAKKNAACIGELFGQIMMACGESLTKKADAPLKKLLFYVGKWVYLIDATDDAKRDFSKGCYNPFLSFCGEDFCFDDVEKQARPLLYDCIDRIIEGYKDIDATVGEGALSNIIYRGFRSRTEQVLAAKGEKCKETHLKF